MSAAAQFANYQKTKIIAGLDGLRAISIFAVVWHHTVGAVESISFSRFGFLGVDLFFVISGFLIVTLLLREKTKKGDISLKNFYARRVLRIFPLYFGVILGLAFIYYVFVPGSAFGQQFLSDLPWHVLFLANFYPVSFSITWSLAAEEQFYLIWPFIEKHLGKFIYLGLAFAIGVNQFYNFKRDFVSENFGIPKTFMETTYTPILLGVLAAHLLHQQKTFEIFEKLLNSKISTIVLFSVLLILLSTAPQDIAGLTLISIHILLMLIVISIVVSPNQPITNALSFRAMRRIGAISFGIYLFHIHCIMVARKLLSIASIDNNILLFLVSFAITACVAELSYRFYEQRFLALKSNFK